MIHTVLRGALADAVRLVRSAPAEDRERAGLLADYVLELGAVLHTHHHGEDELLWDRLETRAPTCGPHVAQMRAHHAHIAELLVEVEAMVPDWRATASSVDRDRVADGVQAVLIALEEHLGAEEADILPVAAATLTQKEFDELGEHGRASIPRDRMMFQLGTILATSGVHAEQFWKELPPPVRLLYRLIGRRQYDRERARLEGSAA